MEFTVKRSHLVEELGFVNSVVEKKSTIPVLSDIRIDTVFGHAIRITGTDLDVTLGCDVPVISSSREADGKADTMCVQGRKLYDLVRALNDGSEITFKKEENSWVQMTSGRASFRIAGHDANQYPEIPEFKATPLSISAVMLRDFIQNTQMAITNEQSRFTLCGAKFIIEPGFVRMVTTDGHRLALIEKKADDEPYPASLDVLIPKKVLQELVKISKGVETVTIGQDMNHIYFSVPNEAGTREMITRKLSGNFPNYEMVIPKDNDQIATFDLETVRRAMKRIALMADERTRSARIIVRPNEVELQAQSSEEGSGSEIVECEYAGDRETTLGFNHQYVREFLDSIGNIYEEKVEDAKEGEKAKPKPPRVRFSFKDQNNQTLWTLDDGTGYDYKYIVMPLRI